MTKEYLKEHAFKKGQSGNPLGRPPRFMSKKEWLDKNITEDMRLKLLNKAYKSALSGKPILEFLLARVLPSPTVEEMVDIDLRKPSHKEKGDEIFAALAEKRISPSQAHMLFATLCNNVKLVEMTEIVERIEKLENGR